MTDLPQISVIIVNYNGGKWLSRCIDSLNGQTMPYFECFIIDNGSTDGSIETLPVLDARFKIIKVGENIGFAAANNLGVSKSQGRWIALLNPDAFARPDWLEKGLAIAQSDDRITMVGSLQYMALEPNVYDGFGDCYHLFGLAWRSWFGHTVEATPPIPLRPYEVFAPCAAAGFYKRAPFERLGGFDERFFCYHEDVDIGFRMRLDGGICIQAHNAIVDHVSSGISGRASEFSVYHGTRNRIWTYVKNMPGLSMWVLLPAHILTNLAFLAWSCVRPARFRPTLRGILHALKGLPVALEDRRRIQKERKVGFWDLFSFKSGKSIFALSPFKVVTREVHVKEKSTIAAYDYSQ